MTQISKWCCLCFMTMLAFTATVSAQVYDETDGNNEPTYVYDEDDIDGTSNLILQKLVIGGNGTFGIANSVLFYEISPFIGYRLLNDRWVTGIGFNFSRQSQKYANEPDYTDIVNQTFSGPRILTRYLLLHIGDPAGVYGVAEYQYNRINYTRKVNNEVIDELKLDPKASMLFGLGYSSNYYQGFGYNVEVFYDALHKDGESFTEWPIVYRVGFTYGF